MIYLYVKKSGFKYTPLNLIDAICTSLMSRYLAFFFFLIILYQNNTAFHEDFSFFFLEYQELKSQAAKILGSVDFLGNPLGLVNDITEGIAGFVKDGNVSGLLKNFTHGVSNSTAKVIISFTCISVNLTLTKLSMDR